MEFTDNLKSQLLGLILTEARVQLKAVTDSMQSAYEETTHEDSKQEGKYDTRAIEAGYLAGAQAERAKLLESDIETIERLKHSIETDMKHHDQSEKETVSLGDVVVLSDEFGNKKDKLVVLLPCLGGFEVFLEGVSIISITSKSPLGLKLSKAMLDDEITLSFANEQLSYIISAIY